MDLKKCSKCGAYFPRSTDYFVRDKKRKDGLKPNCKQCDRNYYLAHRQEICAKSAEYRKQNIERVREQQREYYKKNRDKISAYKKEYAKKNADKLKEYRKANRERRIQQKRKWDKANKSWRIYYDKLYRKEHEEELRQKRLAKADKIRRYCEWYRKHFPDRRKKTQRKYYETHQDEVAIRKHKRIARERSLPRNFSKVDWEECLDFFDYKDAYTGLPMKRPTQDHVIPVSKGGGYIKSNIVPCDYHINASKQDQDMETWFRKQPFFSEKRLMKIYEWMSKGGGLSWLTSS
jgi:hypothetical protein